MPLSSQGKDPSCSLSTRLAQLQWGAGGYNQPACPRVFVSSMKILHTYLRIELNRTVSDLSLLSSIHDLHEFKMFEIE